MPKPSVNMSAIGSPAGTIMLTNQRNEGLYSDTWWVWSTWYENWVWWTTSENTRPNNPAFSTPNQGDTTPDSPGGPNNYWRGVDISANNRSTFVFIDGHAKSHAAGTIFPGYARKPNGNQPENPQSQGVCL